MSDTPTPDPILTRQNLLLRSIEFYTKQANRAAMELHELLYDGDDEPLAILDHKEYAGVIEAKPQRREA